MEEEKKEVLYLSIDEILPNRFQPRLTFDEKELTDLSNSIIKYGVIQPIVVRKIGVKYEIIAGERRYKASVLAGLKKVPALLVESDDNTSAEIALLENLQRKNLTPIEEAQSYKKLLDKGFTQDDIASKLGVSQSSIANKVRLLNLPQEVQDALLYNKISERHARGLLTLQNKDLQNNLLNRIINERLTVKQTEEEVSLLLNKDNIMEEKPAVNLSEFLSMNTSPVQAEEKNVQNNDEIDEILSFDAPEVINIVEDDEGKEENIVNPFENNNTSANILDNNVTMEDKSIVDNTSEQLTDSNISNDENKEELSNIENISAPVISEENIVNNEEIDKDTMDFESIIPASNPLPVENKADDKKGVYFPSADQDDELYDEENSEELGGEYEDLPFIINKIRDFIRSIDESNSRIVTDEVDLPECYRIMININKN